VEKDFKIDRANNDQLGMYSQAQIDEKDDTNPKEQTPASAEPETINAANQKEDSSIKKKEDEKPTDGKTSVSKGRTSGRNKARINY